MDQGQYGQHVAGGNPRAYMTMRDYRNLAWQNQQSLGINPNPNRSMRDYKDQWMSAHVYSVPSTYAPPVSPHATSTPQPPQPPQLISPVEQAILNLKKLVDNFKEEKRVVNVQANQEINTVESSLNKKLDGFQSEIDQKFDILQESISKLTNQFVYQKEENPEKECLVDTTVEEQYKMQDEAISPFLTGEGSRKEAVEEPKKHVLKSFPTELNPNANAQATYNPLPVAPSTDLVYTLPVEQPTPAVQFTPEAPTTKATPSLPMLQNFKKLVAIVQTFVTTSKKMATAHIAWHSGWFGCWFGFGAPEPRHSCKLR